MSLSSKRVRTVGGDIAPDALGHTQCHEHIWLDRGASYRVNPALCMDDYDASLCELRRYAQFGGGSIVDAQPGGFGRNLPRLRDLQRASGVNIVAVSGCHKRCFLDAPERFANQSERALADCFIRELTDGVEGVRTGMLKLALDVGGLDNPAYATFYPAVMRAAAETGAPLMVHTETDSDVLALIARAKARGVPAERLLVCHLDRMRPDPQYHLRVLDTGCVLCYDSIHRYKYVSDAQELALVARVLDAGYVGQIVLGLDTTNRRLRAYGAEDVGLDSILTEFLPKLREQGVSDAQIEKMCRSNAACLLTWC